MCGISLIFYKCFYTHVLTNNIMTKNYRFFPLSGLRVIVLLPTYILVYKYVTLLETINFIYLISFYVFFHLKNYAPFFIQHITMCTIPTQNIFSKFCVFGDKQ